MSNSIMSANKQLIDHKPLTQESYGAIARDDEEHTRDHTVLFQSAAKTLIDQQPSTQKGYGAIAREGEDPTSEHRQLSQTHIALVNQGPKNYMGYAILSAIFCCLPLGIPAVYFAFKTCQHKKKMDWPKARESALKTRQLVQMAVSLGLVMWFLGLVILIAVSKPHK